MKTTKKTLVLILMLFSLQITTYGSACADDLEFKSHKQIKKLADLDANTINIFNSKDGSKSYSEISKKLFKEEMPDRGQLKVFLNGKANDDYKVKYYKGEALNDILRQIEICSTIHPNNSDVDCYKSYGKGRLCLVFSKPKDTNVYIVLTTIEDSINNNCCLERCSSWYKSEEYNNKVLLKINKNETPDCYTNFKDAKRLFDEKKFIDKGDTILVLIDISEQLDNFRSGFLTMDMPDASESTILLSITDKKKAVYELTKLDILSNSGINSEINALKLLNCIDSSCTYTHVLHNCYNKDLSNDETKYKKILVSNMLRKMESYTITNIEVTGYVDSLPCKGGEKGYIPKTEHGKERATKYFKDFYTILGKWEILNKKKINLQDRKIVYNGRTGDTRKVEVKFTYKETLN